MRAVAFCHILSSMMSMKRISPSLSKEEVFRLIHCDTIYQDAIWVKSRKYVSDEVISDKMQKLYDEYEEWVLGDKYRRSMLYATKKI